MHRRYLRGGRAVAEGAHHASGDTSDWSVRVHSRTQPPTSGISRRNVTTLPA
jgi:hypothetical protein